MTRSTLLSLAGILLISAMPVTAHAKPNADSNQDGKITRAEFDAASDARFTKTDTNSDGYISADERIEARATKQSEKAGAHFDRLDQNGDGFVSRSEFEQKSEDRKEKRRDRIMDFADENKDGQISDSERKTAKEKHRAKRKENRQARRDNRGEDSNRGRRGPNKLKGADTNGDGLVSYQEYAAGADRLFEHLDVNKDGVLMPGEGKDRRRKKRRRFMRR